MVTAKTQYSLRNAQEYFEEHLAVGDYYEDPNARAVRIELSAERSLLLPFDQFAFAELKTDGKQQHLRLVFATHEVSVRGNSLRRVETAMQRKELSFVAALPRNHRPLVPDGQPVILDIFVTEIPCAGMHSHVSQE